MLQEKIIPDPVAASSGLLSSSAATETSVGEAAASVAASVLCGCSLWVSDANVLPNSVAPVLLSSPVYS